MIISESSVDAFTIQQWSGTTTLKPTFDLTEQESALLEVRNDLPKVNNAKGNVFQKETTFVPKHIFEAQIGTNAPTRTSENTPEVNNKMTETSSTSKLPSKNALQTFGVTNKVTQPIYDLTNPGNFQSTIINEEINTTTDKQGVTTLIPNNATITYAGPSENKISVSNKNDQSNVDLTTLFVEDTTLVIQNISEDTLVATEESPLLSETTPHTNNNDPFTNTDMTILETETTSIIGKENIAGDIETPTETMAVEASSYITTNPSWKTYTTIERKRTKPLEIENPSTGSRELLAKAETIPVKFTLENAENDTPIPSLKELNQELMSNAKTQHTRSNVEDSTHSSTNQPTTASLGAKLTSTLNVRTSPDNIVSSKRAGYLDLTADQADSQTKTTTDILSINETELVGALFEVDPQENDGPEMKNGSESQSQMAEDEIKEKLLEEQVLNDDLVKTYKNQKSVDPNEIKKEPTTEDSLGVKPINSKTGLYTVSPHYKRMKKIEVQPLKPFVRDPDDNSWRNESLSLLGIVFKAKNASKPFTQVLKNKTEAVLSNISGKDDKNEVTDLRERLEKIAEVRKSRKKKINKTGDTIYSDYEEGNSAELAGSTPKTYTQKSTPKIDTSIPLFNNDGKLAFSDRPTSSSVGPESTTSPGVFMYKEQVLTTRKPKKLNKFPEYYDTTDEYDADYLTLPKLDLKKFTTSFFKKDTVTTPFTPLTTQTKPLTTYWPDRKPTIQYFPPRPQSQKVNSNDYDSDFEKRIKMFSFSGPPKDMTLMLAGLPPTTLPPHESPTEKQTHSPPSATNKPDTMFKNFYATFPSRLVDAAKRYSADTDESFNRASYVIKHYKDLLDEAVKDDYDKSGEFAYTNSPLLGVTANEMAEGKLKPSMDDDNEYMSNFHKEILDRFVDNFNQNSEKFKVDFPILYNNSIVHRKAQDNGRAVASSTTFLKRQYGEPMPGHKPCETNCDMKVELSPAYELHYYVPDQEEKEEAEPRLATSPYMYRL
ncbi:hypothetical protein evm_000247 [Chilo suppressalis]|nr:hypothetical protein evm_000247 [Chilo suppressalis]